MALRNRCSCRKHPDNANYRIFLPDWPVPATLQNSMKDVSRKASGRPHDFRDSFSVFFQPEPWHRSFCRFSRKTEHPSNPDIAASTFCPDGYGSDPGSVPIFFQISGRFPNGICYAMRPAELLRQYPCRDNLWQWTDKYQWLLHNPRIFPESVLPAAGKDSGGSPAGKYSTQSAIPHWDWNPDGIPASSGDW